MFTHVNFLKLQWRHHYRDGLRKMYLSIVQIVPFQPHATTLQHCNGSFATNPSDSGEVDSLMFNIERGAS